MVLLLVLSIFIASISFVYIRYPSNLWSFSHFLRRTKNPPISNSQSDSISNPQSDDLKKIRARLGDVGLDFNNNVNITTSRISAKNQIERRASDAHLIKRKNSDSKAMPPPPSIPGKKILSPSHHNHSSTNLKNTMAGKTPELSLTDVRDTDNLKSIYSGLTVKSRAMPPQSGNPSSFVMRNSSQSSLRQTSNQTLNGLAPSFIQPKGPLKSNKKIILEPGHSPLDWARLTKFQPDLSGLPSGTSYLKIPRSLLSKQNGRKGKDAWTILGGKVYNITPYLPFHPGGEHELLRSAGKDGTKLFTDIHPWVNWQGMLAACLVGIPVDENELHVQSKIHELD